MSYLKNNFQDGYDDDDDNFKTVLQILSNFITNIIFFQLLVYLVSFYKPELQKIFASKVMEILHIHKKRKEEKENTPKQQKPMVCVETYDDIFS